MGAGSFSVTFDRQSVVDFTNGFFEEPTRILILPLTKQHVCLHAQGLFKLRL